MAKAAKGYLLLKPDNILEASHKGASVRLVKGFFFPACGTKVLFLPDRITHQLPKEVFGAGNDPRRQVFKKEFRHLSDAMGKTAEEISKGKMKPLPVYEYKAQRIKEESGGATEWIFLSPVITGFTNYEKNMFYLEQGVYHSVIKAAQKGPGMSIAFPVYAAKKNEISIPQKVLAICRGIRRAIDGLAEKGAAAPESVVFLQNMADAQLRRAIGAFCSVFKPREPASNH